MASPTDGGVPYYLTGPVIHGFNRGGKLLGFPTANIPISSCPQIDSAELGVYFGWGQVESGEVLEIVMCVGWNPQFADLKQKAVEVHFLHTFAEDFYGQTVRVIALGYIRNEKKFESLDALIAEIKNDVRIGQERLATPELAAFKNNPFFLR